MSEEPYSRSAEGLLELLDNLSNEKGYHIIDVLHKGGSDCNEKGSANQVRVNIVEDHKDKYDVINAMKMSGLINYQITF
jgi:hypothetical protein